MRPVAGTLSVEIVSRFGGTAWEGEATQVSVPLLDGELGVMPGRQPVLAVVSDGEVRLTTTAGEQVAIAVEGGFCSLDHDVLTVAADLVGDEVAEAHASGETVETVLEDVTETHSGAME